MLLNVPFGLPDLRQRKNLLVTIVSAFILLMLPSAAFAGEGYNNGTPDPHGNINICITGSVIDWAENPLAPGDGWTAITAIAYPGLQSVSIPTNADGTFAVSLPTPPGSTHWEFTIAVQPGWEGVTPLTFNVPVDLTQTGCKAIRFKLKEWVKVIVIKIDQDHNLLPGWTIHANPGPNNPFGQPQAKETDAYGEVYFHLTPGIWVFTESPPAGVHYTPIAPSSGAQTVNVQPPGPITIRFKNRVKPKGCVDVHKRDTYGVGLPGWKFQLLYANGTVAEAGVTDAFGHLRFDHLLHGPYQVVETQQYGWKPVTPTHVDVVVDGGAYGDDACESVWFENMQYHGYCIEGQKVDKNGNVGLPGWIISADPQTAGGLKPANVTTDGTGYFRFDLPDNDYRVPGETYKVCETVKDGWVAHGDVCYEVTLPKKPGYCVEVPKFINKQKQYDTVDVEDGSGYGKGNHGHDKPHTTSYDTSHHNDGCGNHHVVKHGEALYSIGSQYSKTAQQMLDANPWVRNQPHFYVYVGQKLCIP